MALDDEAARSLAAAARELAEAARELRGGGGRGGGQSGGSSSQGGALQGAAAFGGEIASMVVALQGATQVIGSLAAGLTSLIPGLSAFGDEIQAQTQALRMAVGVIGTLTSASGDVTSQLAPFALAGIDVSGSLDRAARPAAMRAVRMDRLHQQSLEAVGAQLPAAYGTDMAQHGPAAIRAALGLLGFNAGDSAAGD